MVSVRLACVCPAGLSQRCVLENRRFEYEISREAGGGSGGEEYWLIAAKTVDSKARRDIWCKFVEIFIHFSICTLCKGIASAAKATGLTEVGIVFQRCVDKGIE